MQLNLVFHNGSEKIEQTLLQWKHYELRERILYYTNTQGKIYKLDKIALQTAYEVVLLSSHHCRYNFIELIWAQVKTEAAKNNTNFKFNDTEKLLNDASDSVSVDNWKKCTDHCHKLQDDDFLKEG